MPVALYILNQKRINLRDLERRFGVAIVVEADDALTGANYHTIERSEPASGVKSEGESTKSVAEIPPINKETELVRADEDEAFEPRGEENEEVARLSDHRRRRLAGGKRPKPPPPPPSSSSCRAAVRRKPLARSSAAGGRWSGSRCRDRG